jgi:hypothetical protein
MRRDVDDLADLVPWKAPPAPPATDPQFWANVELWESEAWNAPGSEKAWVEHFDEDWAAMIGSVVREGPPLTGRARLLRALRRADVRYLIIGVGGAALHAETIGARLYTKDLDLFLPRDPENLLACWTACETAGFELWSGSEPLDMPRDLWLAGRVVAQSALTTAQGPDALPTDLTFVMGRLDFEDVWLRRSSCDADTVPADVARLSDIVEAKRHADREKDRTFLTKNRAVLEELLRAESPPETRP